MKAAPVCFHLVFASHQEQGLFEMNDAMAVAMEEFYRETYPDDLLFGNSIGNLETQTARDNLRQMIVKDFAHKPSFTITDVKRQGMQTDYLLLRGGEYRKLVIEMSKGELEKLDPGPAKNDSTRYRVKKAR